MPKQVIHIVRVAAVAHEGGTVRDRAFYLYFRQFSWIKTVSLGRNKIYDLIRVLSYTATKNRVFLLHISGAGFPILNNGFIGRIATVVFYFWLKIIARSNKVFLEFNDLFVEQARDLDLSVPRNFERIENKIFAISGITFVFASESMRKYACQKHGLRQESTLAIPNGEFEVPQLKHKRGAHTKNAPLKFVYAGTLNKGRSIEDLIHIFSGLHCELTLIGTNGEWIEKEYTLPKNITYLPPLSAEKLVDLLQDFDMGLIPYPADREYYHIAYPTKLSTFLLAGLPFLSTPVREVEQTLIRHPGIGFCVAMERWQFFLRKLHFSKVEAARVKARNIRHYFSWHHLFLPLQHELESANIESKPAGASIETAGGTSELKVSVLMPAFNAEQFIRDAIESILAQTFRNFEFIIIDDGSSDHTSEIIKTFKDSRIRFHRNKKNLGIVRTLNKGLALAKGKYIARMDADDISLPERLAKQVEFMDQNPEIVVSGGAIEEFSIENSRPLRVHKMPEEPAEIRALLLFQCVLMHPTIIMRRSIIASEKFRYSPRDRHVEDFGMWQRISFSHCLANLPDVLLKYRLSPQSITHLAEKKVYERDQAHIAIYQQALNRFNVGANKYELTALRHLIMRRENISIEEICAVKELLKRMRAKLPTKLYDLNIFNDIVARKFLGLLWTALPDGNVRLASEAIAASALFRRYSIFSAAGIVQRCDCYILKAIIGFALRLKEQLSR